ncbi:MULTISPECIES: heavy-metal-associated domain-containing protein [Cyanophyceae]|uniref:Heavy-metal-associated domain-containing protein n=1 Tax=Leptolyngbya subtilissima DQ-A4 TaxID=2933933 RepID=A0ABV0K446_9CYAN|nr:heavy-metal-associated domain-containing protein [Nodosilinea sp. FACHB-141]MBD2111456.1 heavy-metal-associated domain-containing protein [Nodosilinea sp. FACHB-141]
MTTLSVTVPDMACGACVSTITQAVQAVDPSAEVKTDLASKAVDITASVTAEALTEAIQKAGYTVQA